MSDDLFDHDADMLRRAAIACRNFKQQAAGRTDWFDWVPAHLEQMADRLDGGTDVGRLGRYVAEQIK